MAVTTVPVRPLPSQRVKCLLAGQQCDLSLYLRNGALFMDLNVNGDSVGKGMICRNRCLIPSHASIRFSGKLRFIDTLGSKQPKFAELGSRYLLQYLSEDTLREEADELRSFADPLANVPPHLWPPIIHSYTSQDDPE